MIDKHLDELRTELEALGWHCHESHTDGRWTIHLIKGERSLVSSGSDRRLIWQAVYLDAIREHSA